LRVRNTFVFLTFRQLEPRWHSLAQRYHHDLEDYPGNNIDNLNNWLFPVSRVSTIVGI
jgi:hypothetical protein